MKAVLLSVLVSVASISAFASGTYQLGDEANKALTALSACSDAYSEMMTAGRWIGYAERWDDRSGAYGYTYYVYERDGFVAAKAVGKMMMKARRNFNPAPDSPGYVFSCVAEEFTAIND